MPPTTQSGLPTADQVIEETFLTPRVIDRRAFDDYSTALQDLIREASGRGQTLQTAVGDVKVLGESLRQATKELKSRLETAVKVMPTLDQRVSRAEQVLGAMSGTRLAEHVEKTIEATVAAKIADLERRVAAIVGGAEQRLGALDRAIAGKMPLQAAEIESLVKSKVDQAQVQLLQLQEQALGQVQTAQNELQTQVAAVTGQMGVLQRQAAETAGAIEAGINRHWDEVRARIEKMERDVLMGADQVRSRTKAELEETLGRIEARRGQVEAAASEIEEQLRGKVDQARQQIGAMERDILAGTAGVRQKARADLEEMLGRVQGAVKEAGDRTGEVRTALLDLSRQAREQAADIEGRLDRRMELANAKAESFLLEVEARAGAVAGAGAGLDERIARAAAELEDLLTRARERTGVLASAAERSAEAAKQELETRAVDMLKQLGVALEDAQSVLVPMHDTSRTLIEQIDERLGRVAWEYQSAVAPHVTRLEKLCAEGARLAGSEGVASSVGEITGLAERAEHLKKEAESVLGRLEEVSAQAEQARRAMAESIADAAARLEEQQARLDFQQSRLDEQLGLSQTVLSNAGAAEERLELAKRAQGALERTLAETIAVARQAIAVVAHTSPATVVETVHLPEVTRVAPPAIDCEPESNGTEEIRSAVEAPDSAASAVESTPVAAKPAPTKPMMDMFARLRAELQK